MTKISSTKLFTSPRLKLIAVLPRMAVCVAVIGKDNSPLYFRFRGKSPEDQLQAHFIVSSALDIIEERVHSSKVILPSSSVASGAIAGSSQTAESRELYLGALTAQQEYKVYGYMTNTKIKFVIVIEESSIPLRENDIRMMFRKLHGAFCDLMSNPFYTPGTEITSKRFVSVVDSLIGLGAVL